MTQPFTTQQVVRGAEFTDREVEVGRVLDAMPVAVVIDEFQRLPERAVAAGEQQFTARDVMDRYDLASSSAASYAINQLRYDGLLAPGKPFRVSDPFFAAWILDSAMSA